MHRYLHRSWTLAVILTISFGGMMMGQSVAEENAWEAVLMAPDNVVKIQRLKDYLAAYCEGSNNGIYCARARTELRVRGVEMPESQFQRYCAIQNLARSIEELELMLVSYPSGEYALKVRQCIAQKENDYWNHVFGDVQKWHQDSFSRYLEIFPNGPHAEVAESQISLLAQLDQLDPQTTFDLFVDGKGRERLEFFQAHYPDHAAAMEAQNQLAAIEETLWRDVSRRGQVGDYRRYLARSTQLRYRNEAEKAIEELMKKRIGAMSRKERQWQLIAHTNDPKLVRDFLVQYQGDTVVEKARIRLIELDQGWWEQAISLGTAAAYQGYLQRFPGGAFAKHAGDSLALVTNDAEDIYWSTVAEHPSIELVNTYIQSYPQGKYSALAQNLLVKLSPGEYQITHKDHRHLVEFSGVSNLKVSYFSDDLIVDDQELISKHLLTVTPLNLGFYHIVLEDDAGREIRVDWNREISVAYFQEQEGLITMILSGGYQPYRIRLQDTASITAGKTAEIEQEYSKGTVTIEKEGLRDLVGPGTFALKIKDLSRKQIAHAGIVHFDRDWRSLLLSGSIGGLVLLGGLLLWRRFNRKINLRKSVFDDMEYDEDWEVEG